MTQIRSIEWVSETPSGLVPGHLRILDQTLLPEREIYIETKDLAVIDEAIRYLRVRGAPAIGIAAAMGIAAHVQHANDVSTAMQAVHTAASLLAKSRRTAINLFHALARMQRVAESAPCVDLDTLKQSLAAEAIAIRDEDARMCRAIGEHALELLHGSRSVLTHCNAGALATSELGTATAPIYISKQRGKALHVFVDETRPLLQGSRLTAWELSRAGVDVTLICDSAAATVMKEGRVDAVIVGADRIVANGDTANKIGTYGLALIARAHDIPFYVLAPTTTIDTATSSGNDIPIEERAATEITHGFGKVTAPPAIDVYAPAFDVTPAELITAIVCEKGVIRPDYIPGIAAII
jgi:methylthioribose-1-phosphate isomerase